MSRPTKTSGKHHGLGAAVRSDDLAAVTSILAAGSSVKTRSVDIESALLFAVRRRNTAVASILLNYRDERQAPPTTALVLGIAGLGNSDLARRVFDLVPDLGNVVTRGGHTPLHAAAASGNPDVVKLLLARDVSVNAVRTWDAGTPLHDSAREGHLSAVTLLLTAGAQIDAGDRDGMTALAWADLGGHDDVAGLLVMQGADSGTRRVHQRTALHRAVYNGVANVRVALRDGVDVNAQDLWGNTAVHLVACRDRIAILRALLDAEASTDVQNKLGETALHVAATDQGAQHLATVRLLLERGTNVNLASCEGWSALHALVFMDAPDLLKLAIGQGANLEHRDNKGETPLLTATGYCAHRCIDVLLDAGADPTARNHEDRSAADLLVQWGALMAEDRAIAETARVLKWGLVEAAQPA